MKNRMFMVSVSDPRTGELLNVPYTEMELRTHIADIVSHGVNASCNIEGVGLEHPPKIDPMSVPECLLTTP